MITSEMLKHMREIILSPTDAEETYVDGSDVIKILDMVDEQQADLLQARKDIAVLAERLKAAQEDAAYLSRALKELYDDSPDNYTIVDEAQAQHRALVAQEAKKE